MKAFATCLHDARNTLEIVFQRGDCVLFDNRRILHARRQPENVGEMRVRGAYVGDHAFKYTMERLNSDNLGCNGLEITEKLKQEARNAHQSMLDDEAE